VTSLSKQLGICVAGISIALGAASGSASCAFDDIALPPRDGESALVEKGGPSDVSSTVVEESLGPEKVDTSERSPGSPAAAILATILLMGAAQWAEPLLFPKRSDRDDDARWP
jgi:hypothetical protein